MLITSGPTWVALDAMRVLSNRSSGRMGRALCEELKRNKARITLLEGPVTIPVAKKQATVKKFKFYDELAALLKQELKKKYDVVIHAAAVSDFKPRTAAKGKIHSTGRKSIQLVPTAKLINSIKAGRQQPLLVGFKLEPGLTKSKAYGVSRKLFTDAHCDLVVANSINKRNYHGFIVSRDKKVVASGISRRTIVKALIKIIKGLL